MNACEASSTAVDLCAVEPLSGLAAWLGTDTIAPGEAVRDLLFGEMSSSRAHGESMTSEIAGLAWADLRARLVASLGDGTRASSMDRPAPPQSDFPALGQARWSCS